MSNKNHNNSQSWKSKLNELESLPGEAMPDNNVAWEKLYARLEGRKPQKKAVWYWLAAACVLLLFIIPLIVSDKKDHQLTITVLKQNQPETKRNTHQEHAFVAITNHKKDSVTVKHPVLSKRNVTIISDKSTELIHNNLSGNKTEKFRIYDTVSNQNPLEAKVKRPLQAIDTFSGFVLTVPVKKRLPVVHNNELDDPVDIPPQVARNVEKPSLHFLKLASQEVYHNSPVSVTKNFATINFKSSPN